MAERRYPFELKPVSGSHPPAHVDNAVASLESEGSQALVDAGLVPPDVLFAQTLMLLASQPRVSDEQRDRPAGGSAVAGGVWVREQLTLHRPVRIAEPFVIDGQIARRYSRKGREYSVSISKTRNERGELLVTNRTTGLVRYRADPTLADSEQGRADADLPPLGADWRAAAKNPAAIALRSTRQADSVVGPTCEVSLEMMRVRDGGRNANPIHTEPEQARRAGLSAPIAGGPHVFGFVQALLVRAFGPEALLFGTHIDVRWRAPVHAGQSVTASTRIASVAADRIGVNFQVEREGTLAMVGSALIPLESGTGE